MVENLTQILSQYKRVVFVSSIAGSMINEPIEFHGEPITYQHLQEIIKVAKEQNKEIVNYIGHPTTVSLLGQLLSLQLQTTRSEYQIQKGDLLIMVSLKQRQKVSGQEVNVSSVEDLLIRLVVIRS